jgi:hypothetical protein
MNFFLHHGCNNQQISARQAIDTTQWHNYAVDWQPDGITGYIDGVQWFRTTNVGYLPPGPMHQGIQLDWFPDGKAILFVSDRDGNDELYGADKPKHLLEWLLRRSGPLTSTAAEVVRDEGGPPRYHPISHRHAADGHS